MGHSIKTEFVSENFSLIRLGPRSVSYRTEPEAEWLIGTGTCPCGASATRSCQHSSFTHYPYKCCHQDGASSLSNISRMSKVAISTLECHLPQEIGHGLCGISDRSVIKSFLRSSWPWTGYPPLSSVTHFLNRPYLWLPGFCMSQFP